MKIGTLVHIGPLNPIIDQKIKIWKFKMEDDSQFEKWKVLYLQNRISIFHKILHDEKC